jgi:protein-S-isoprenylcysteine O-methyltransferase Ste14
MEKDIKYTGHGDRNDLAGEHVWGDAGQIILFLIFLAIWVVDSFIFKYSTFLSNNIPIYVRLPIALVILSGSAYFARSGHRMIFDENREPSTVIRKGVFNMVRHPLYLGSLLFYAGLIVLTLSIFSIVIWLGIIGFYHFISRYEEKLLLDKFGTDYEKYMSQVPMWTPRMRIGIKRIALLS